MPDRTTIVIEEPTAPKAPTPSAPKEARKPTANLHTSPHLRPPFTDSYRRLWERMERVYGEYIQRVNGAPAHWAHITDGESVPEIRRDLIELARAFADMLAQESPRA